MRVLCFVLCLLAFPALAGPSDSERIEAYLASPDRNDTGHVMRVYLLAECMEAINDDLIKLFDALRMEGSMPARSDTWCIENGFLPRKYRMTGTPH